ncbi:hypothetical protein ACFS7Z_26090 [Pontibacter toksunensis]|uniref:Uncharacterized protein n=1 Tax=Pontibacter toksunensis TaxID=1332631 RepID=A0ABW6C3S9_9BACT
METFTNYLQTSEGITLASISIVLLTFYITGVIKAKHGQIVIIKGYIDYVVLIIGTIGLGCSIYFESRVEYNDYFTIASIIAVAAVSITLLFSIASNKGSLLNMIISFLSKLFIMLIFAFLFVVRALELLNAGNAKNKNKRYKDGTKGNLSLAAHNKNRKFTDLLIRSLIYKG